MPTVCDTAQCQTGQLTVTYQSAPHLLILHAVRLLGFAESRAIAQRAGVSHDEALSWLQMADRQGWIQYQGFADLNGWSLTDTGKEENERQLAVEREHVDTANILGEVYSAFVPLNARLLRAVTDWQLRPTGQDGFAPNDHTDSDWDARILDELAVLSTALAPLTTRLSELMTRFGDYSARFDAALAKANNGLNDYVDKTNVDSCHRVWFELHEDLIASLGIDRGTIL